MHLFHKWTVVDRETHPSAFEQLNARPGAEMEGICQWVFTKPVVVTYKCQKCGAMRVVRV